MKFWKMVSGVFCMMSVIISVNTLNVFSVEAQEGTAHLWTLDANDNQVANKVYGPYSGWIAARYTGGGSRNRMLWRNNTDGTVHLWTLDANNNQTATKQYGPYGGWTVQDYWHNGTVGRMVWTHTDGTADVWELDANDNYSSMKRYGPYSGWTAMNYSDATGSRKRLMWRHTGGTVHLWTLDSNGNQLSTKQYGPYSGWTVQDYWHDGTTGRMVWTYIDGTADVWTLDANDNYSSMKRYGPYSGWTARNYHGASSSGGGVTLKTISQETLVVKKAGSGSGTISSGTQVCDGMCQELAITYVAGEQVDLTVTPAADSYFAGWETFDGEPLEDIYYANPGDTVIAVFEKK